jgi:hypothetical protein
MIHIPCSRVVRERTLRFGRASFDNETHLADRLSSLSSVEGHGVLEWC